VTQFGAGGITVTIQHQAEDKFGNFTTTDEVPVGPCAIDFTATTEPTIEPQDTVGQNAMLYAPPGSDIRATDRVLLPDGTRWSVIGNVAPFVNPFTGWSPGTTAQIQRVQG